MSEAVTCTRELDSRVSNGVEVRLLWRERDDSVWVSVTDTRQGEAFRLEVGAGERPLDVFTHPFAYAARHGVTLHRSAGPSDSVPSA